MDVLVPLFGRGCFEHAVSTCALLPCIWRWIFLERRCELKEFNLTHHKENEGSSMCGRNELGQIAKLLILVRSVLDHRFQVGKVRQDRVDECVSEVGLEVTVQEQQTETGET